MALGTTVRSPRPEVHVRSPTWRHPKSKALSVETSSPRSRLVQGETKHITFSPGAPPSHSKAADFDYAGKWTQKSSAEIAGSRHIEYMPPKSPPGLVPKPAASPLKYSGEPSDYYGEWSHKTDMKNAGAQFIEYMAPKNPGEMRPKPTATPLRYSGESSQAKGAERGAAARAEAGFDYAGDWSHETGLKNAGAHFIDYMPRNNPGELRPKHTASPLEYSGPMTSESLQGREAERGASVPLALPRPASPNGANGPAGLSTDALGEKKKHVVVGPGAVGLTEQEWTAAAADAAAVSAAGQSNVFPGERSWKSNNPSPVRTRLHLRPEVAQVMYPDAPLSERRARATVDSIAALAPEGFAEAAGVDSPGLMERGPGRFGLVLNGSVQPSTRSLEAAARSGRASTVETFSRWSRHGEIPSGDGGNGPPIKVERRNGVEAAALISGDAANAGVLAIDSDAPSSLFASGAGLPSMLVNEKMRESFQGPRHGDHHATTFPEIMKESLYGGGPPLVGTAEALAPHRARERAPVVKIPGSDAFEKAAGSASKQVFRYTDPRSDHHHWFSENLRCVPVGVPGLGTDSRPMPTEGAAGISTLEGYKSISERAGLPPDPPSRPLAAYFTEAAATAPEIYNGAALPHVGIPDLIPKAFLGAAGVTSSQAAWANTLAQGFVSRHNAKQAAEAATVAPRHRSPARERNPITGADATSDAAAAETGANAATATGWGSAAALAADAKAKAAVMMSPSARYASMITPPQEFTIYDFGKPPPLLDPSPPLAWEGMPSAYEHAAGLSSNQKNYADTHGDPVFSGHQRTGPIAPSPTPDSLSVGQGYPSPQPSARARREALRTTGDQGVAAALAAAEQPGATKSEWAELPPRFAGGAGAGSQSKHYSVDRFDVVREPSPSAVRFISNADAAAAALSEDAAGLTSTEAAFYKLPVGQRWARSARPVALSEAKAVIYGDLTPRGAPQTATFHEPSSPAQLKEGYENAGEIPELAPSAFEGAAGLMSVEVGHRRNWEARYLSPAEMAAALVPPSPPSKPPPYDDTARWANRRGAALPRSTSTDAFPRPGPITYMLPAAGMGGPSAGFARFKKGHLDSPNMGESPIRPPVNPALHPLLPNGPAILPLDVAAAQQFLFSRERAERPGLGGGPIEATPPPWWTFGAKPAAGPAPLTRQEAAAAATGDGWRGVRPESALHTIERRPAALVDTAFDYSPRPMSPRPMSPRPMSPRSMSLHSRSSHHIGDGGVAEPRPMSPRPSTPRPSAPTGGRRLAGSLHAAGVADCLQIGAPAEVASAPRRGSPRRERPASPDRYGWWYEQAATAQRPPSPRGVETTALETPRETPRDER